MCVVLAAGRIQAEQRLADLRAEDARLRQELVDSRRQDQGKSYAGETS
jgi:hypothetical protein